MNGDGPSPPARACELLVEAWVWVEVSGGPLPGLFALPQAERQRKIASNIDFRMKHFAATESAGWSGDSSAGSRPASNFHRVFAGEASASENIHAFARRLVFTIARVPTEGAGCVNRQSAAAVGGSCAGQIE